jgi:small lipoprotein (TIGR04452 family)
MRKIGASILILFLMHNCMVLEEVGIPTRDSVSGKEAKEAIAEATFEAVTTGQLLWLAQKGMQAGIREVGFLTVINGFLASFLQPILSPIPDNELYTQRSLNECTKTIRGRAAFLYGAYLDSLPPGGAITASIRDGLIIPELASCKLEKTGNLLHIEPVINL